MDGEVIFFGDRVDGQAEADFFELFAHDAVVVGAVFFVFFADEEVVGVFDGGDHLVGAVGGGRAAAVVVPADVFYESLAFDVWEGEAQGFEPGDHSFVVVVNCLARTGVGDFSFLLG